MAGYGANLRAGKILHHVIRIFSKFYKINLDEAIGAVESFHTFNEFFDRRLKKGARTIDSSAKSVISPVDGTVLSLGSLNENIIIEAKGTGSSLDDLLVMPGFKKRFNEGNYIVIYLSPRDYHRIHCPVNAKIIGYSHIPGRLYPVNTFAVNNIDRLFSVNERVISYLETDKNKLCSMVKVGATNVGSVKLTYMESLKTNRVYRKKITDIFMNPITINKGDEIAWFELGSTVILLFETGMVNLRNLNPGDRLSMGEAIADLK